MMESRKYFELKSGIVLLIIISIASGLVNCKGAAQKKPNIILIMADDMGYGDLSCYGNKTIHTPVLDQMAREGMKFTSYYSNGPVCTPTRAALMTGNYQQRAGLEGVIYAGENLRHGIGLSEEELTMGEIFQDNGYKTGIFGKWHLGSDMEYNPTFHGFDEFYGFVSGNVDYISHRDGIGIYDWWHNTDSIYEEGYVTDLITDRALAFMERNKDEPFLLYLPHEAPHFPFQGRNDKADRLPGQEWHVWGSRPDKENAYKEMIEIMDENIGRVFKKLEELGLADNTFIFFCSDNGPLKFGSNGKLKGFKGSLWEGGIRVPAVAWYPGKIKAGTINNSTVLSMDILPTLISIVGISVNSNFDGVDFSSVMFHQSGLAERPVFWRMNNQWAVKKGDWKYLKIDNNEFLFNMKNDMGEQQNLIQANAAKAVEFKKILERWDSEMNQYEQQTKR